MFCLALGRADFLGSGRGYIFSSIFLLPRLIQFYYALGCLVLKLYDPFVYNLYSLHYIKNVCGCSEGFGLEDKYNNHVLFNPLIGDIV